MKALVSILALNRTRKQRPNWDRVILILSTAVTVGLVVLYLYGKWTARW